MSIPKMGISEKNTPKKSILKTNTRMKIILQKIIQAMNILKMNPMKRNIPTGVIGGTHFRRRSMGTTRRKDT